jgi:hypothetical protein
VRFHLGFRPSHGKRNPDREKLRPRRSTALAFIHHRVLIAVIALHLLFGGVAAIWVVSRYAGGAVSSRFNAASKSPNPSERALEHRVQLQKKMESGPAGRSEARLTTRHVEKVLCAVAEFKNAESAHTQMMNAGGTVSRLWQRGGGASGRRWRRRQQATAITSFGYPRHQPRAS